MTKRTLRQRKRLGQVFLRDPLVVEKIIHNTALDSQENSLEIGPGRGALTMALAQRSARLYALEIDSRYSEELARRFATMAHVHIINTDARHYDYALLPTPLVVVANLPYSTGMAILMRLLHFRQRLSRLIIMFQKEVAARLLATPGSTAYSALSVIMQYYATIQHCFDVSRHAFTPVPAVDSTVLRLLPFTTSPWQGTDEQAFLRLVQSAFVHRRKVLRSNILMAPYWTLSKETLAEIFAVLHLSANIRAQELHITQFVQLTEALTPFVQPTSYEAGNCNSLPSRSQRTRVNKSS
jgi:16S rRNA (adenine1518-N6/adenine1519-N6)-dimethyltransferase